MKISIQTNLPKFIPTVLTAIIDLGEAKALADENQAATHPAWADLQRRRAQSPLKSPYLAIGEAPLLYLPGDAAKFWDDDDKIRVLASKALDAAREREAEGLVLLLNAPGGADAAPLAAEGIALRAYQFDKYKSGDKKKKALKVTLVLPEAGLTAARKAVKAKLDRVDSVNSARDLVNEPGSVATPATFEKKARQLASKTGLKVTVLDQKQLAKEGYTGLNAVGQGGAVPPRMIILRHEPKLAKGRAADKNTPHLGLLGKGITFDSGGLCIKSGNGMWEMKCDMSGAASVLYAMEAIARENPPIRVTGIICAAQNLVDANSTMPGDIIIARNGKSIHIDNTDAEGRVVLSDGMCRMTEEGVTHLVDIATLTGACQRALGHAFTGAFGNDDFVDQFMSVAEPQGEPCWKLPIVEEYTELIKSDVADVNNIASKPIAGATMGALFIREFLGEGISWIHLDIAATAFLDAEWKYFRPGGTGVMVRSFTELAKTMAKK